MFLRGLGERGWSGWVYLEHGLFHASCPISEEVLDELGVRLATASPGHGGIEQVLRVSDERFELGEYGLHDHIDGMIVKDGKFGIDVVFVC